MNSFKIKVTICPSFRLMNCHHNYYWSDYNLTEEDEYYWCCCCGGCDGYCVRSSAVGFAAAADDVDGDDAGTTTAMTLNLTYVPAALFVMPDVVADVAVGRHAVAVVVVGDQAIHSFDSASYYAGDDDRWLGHRRRRRT